MNSTGSARILNADEAAALAPAQVVELSRELVTTNEQLAAMQEQLAGLQHQLDWFKRQVFGQKSEKRIVAGDDAQMSLGELFATLPETEQAPSSEVAGHRRRQRADPAESGEPLSFFDESRVPVETIELSAPEIEGLDESEYETIGHKESYRLAQRPGSFVVLKYRRPVVKVKRDETIHCPAAPESVIRGSRADVSFIAGLLIDKLLYHLPLYRQHQRLIDAGFKLSRPWLTQLVHLAAALLEPIYEAQLDSIRASRVKAMDETPIKAGRTGQGKMKGGYFWPIYGERDEICFVFHESRKRQHVEQTLGKDPPPGSVLLSDGYNAYAHYAQKCGLTRAQCWAHARRKFFDARRIEPERADQALAMIGKLYAVEKRIREDGLTDQAALACRREHARPVVRAFFAWIDQQFEKQDLLPSSPLTAAMAYARERRAGLEVYLDDIEVAIDTNHLERALRVIPMGRKNWLFCWTEIGAHYVGIVQSLLSTCRLHDVDPYNYLVDVLQRIDRHPAADVAQLTPRLWKEHFADQPLRSDISTTTG